MNYQDCKKERSELATFMCRLYRQKLTTCSGGNLSMRLDEQHIIITPSSLDKGVIEAGEIGLMTIDGENLTPHLKPSIETDMHLEIYRHRQDISAIVHAHPVMASSFSAMGPQINTRLTAEAYLVIGKVNFAPYALMGSAALSKIVAEKVKDANVVIMENHGVTTLGKSLLAAYDRMEVLEAAAQMTINTAIMQSARELNAERIAELDRW
mgnify:CR=1 FL=1